MKTTIKTLLFLMIATLGFFNLKIDKVRNSESGLSFAENSASANSELGGSKRYFLKEVTTIHVKETITKPNGSTCTNSYDKTTVSCIGEGSQSCSPSSVKSNEQSTC